MKRYMVCVVFVFLGFKSYQQGAILDIETKSKIENAIKQSFFNNRRNTVPKEFKDSIAFYKKDSNFPYKKVYTAFFDIKPYKNSTEGFVLENFYLIKKENELVDPDFVRVD